MSIHRYPLAFGRGILLNCTKYDFIDNRIILLTNIIYCRLKEATEKRKEALDEAEEHATKVLDSLKQMYYLIDEPKFDAPSHVKTAARRNIKKVLDDLDDIKQKFEDELENGNITERYWKQVRAARDKFDEELHILFPSINLQEKKFSVKEDAFDLFVVHMYNTVIYLQKELARLQVNI